MYAIRLARAYTRRKRIVKFEGGWHGGYDALDIDVQATGVSSLFHTLHKE